MDLISLYLLNTHVVTCKAVGLCGFCNSLLVKSQPHLKLSSVLCCLNVICLHFEVIFAILGFPLDGPITNINHSQLSASENPPGCPQSNQSQGLKSSFPLPDTTTTTALREQDHHFKNLSLKISLP